MTEASNKKINIVQTSARPEHVFRFIRQLPESGLHTCAGLRVNFDGLLAGTFLFNHSCGATLSLSVRYFNGLSEGPIFKERATGSDDCPEYCLYQEKLEKYSARCECAYVRNIIGIIKNGRKTCKISRSSGMLEMSKAYR